VDVATQPDGNHVVRVSYVTTGEIVRAFALNLSLNNGATFDGIGNFQVGDNNGYGIFPGNFRDVINAASPAWTTAGYTPVAPAGDRDALGAIGSGGITVEMGSLYAATAPGTSGNLFDVNVAGHGAVNSTLSLAVNATRGSIVLEDGSTAVSPVLNGTVITFIVVPATPAIRYANYDPDCNVPVWWTSISTATGYTCERWTKATSAWANVKTGVLADFNCGAADCNWFDAKVVADTNYRWRVKATNAAGDSGWGTLPYDCNVILSTCYPATGTTQGSYTTWKNMGRPDCWCQAKGTNQGPRGAGYQCDGDIAGDDTGPPNYYRVYTTDLALLQANWKKTRQALTADPNTWGAGTAKKMVACADIDHADTGPPNYYRVYTVDLSKVQGNWKKKNSSWTGTDKLPGNCPR
jgi:hypothetical protein